VVVKLKKSIGYGCTRARKNKTILGDVPIVKSFARHVNASLFPQEKVSFLHYYGCCLVLWDYDTSDQFSASATNLSVEKYYKED